MKGIPKNNLSTKHPAITIICDLDHLQLAQQLSYSSSLPPRLLSTHPAPAAAPQTPRAPAAIFFFC